MNHKSLLAVAVFAALTASSVFAADMPLKAPVKVTGYDWSGLYVGGNFGWSLGRSSTDWNFGGVPAGSTSHDVDGVLGGFQVGYNLQFGRMVYGMEADFDGTGQKGSSTLTFLIPGNPISLNTDSVRLPWLGTIRGRFGVTLADGWLLYATGGAAFGSITVDASSATTVGLVTATAVANSNTWHTGWTIGAGVESAALIGGNWTARLEYLYVDLGVTGGFCATAQTGASSAACFIGNAPYSPVSTRTQLTDNIIRLGLNYRFGAAPPVAAKY
jgi:outer membrane immunogenic protein